MANPSLDRAVLALAAQQYQRFSRTQVLGLDGTDNQIGTRLGSGLWVPDRFEGVYDLPGAPSDLVALLWSAALALGDEYAVAFEAAAHLHGLWGFRDGAIPLSFIVRNGDHHKIRGIEIHQIEDLFLHLHHQTILHGLVATTVARTIADLASRRRFWGRLRWTVQDAAAAGKVTMQELLTIVDELLRQGKRGLPWLRQLAYDRLREDDWPTERWERRLFELLDAAGEPLPSAQVHLPGRNLPTSVVDFIYKPARLIIEVDGRRWHRREQDMKRDRQRDREAAVEDHETLRYLVEEIRDDPDGVVKEIGTIRRRREDLFRRQ